jgi:hypothetical protein
MYVNGQYISKKHPLWKPGRYTSFGDAAFKSLGKYPEVPEGHVYILTNPHFPNWVKVGKAFDARDRTKSYQTSSPFRDYRLEHYIECDDRSKSEREAHQLMDKNSPERLGEWFRIPLEFAVQLLNSLKNKGEVFNGSTAAEAA